jgi:hypothetical protein
VGLPPPNGSAQFHLASSSTRVARPFGMPDVAQGLNESAPSAAANGFEWLDVFSPHVTLPLTQNEAAEIRDVLKDAAHMMTSPATGTADQNMIQGKLQFVRDHGLPVTVEFQHAGLGSQTRAGLTALGRATRPDFDWIFDRLRSGSAVEIGVTWAAGSGHWFTAAGAVETLGRRWLFYRDPDDGRDTVKISLLSTNASGFLQLEGETGNSLDLAVAASPLPLFGRSCPRALARPC